MQDGIHSTQSEVIFCSGQPSRFGFSVTPESRGDAPNSFHNPPSRMPCPNMPYGAEPWRCSSIPLSIFSNGGYINAYGSQVGIVRNSSPTEPNNGGGGEMNSCNNVSKSSALEERDYIGLSDSSQTPSQAAVVQTNSKSTFSSDCKETELSLGLGLSLVNQGARSTSGQKSTSETKTDRSSVEIGMLQTSSTQESSLPASKQALESYGWVSKETLTSNGNGSLCNFPEVLFGAHTHGVSESRIPWEPSKVQWNNEKYVFNHRASALQPPAAEIQRCAKERHDSQQSSSSVNRLLMENSVGRSAQNVSPVENQLNTDGVTRVESPYGNNLLLPVKSNYEVRYTPNDLLAVAERCSNNSLVALKTWKKTLPNEDLRSSALQSGTLPEFDTGSKACDVSLPRNMLMSPVPNSTIPAKRPFFEVNGDRKMSVSNDSRFETLATTVVAGATAQTGISASTFVTSNMDGQLKVETGQLTNVHPPSGLFSWNNVISQPSGRVVGAENSIGLFNSSVTGNASLPPVQAPSQMKAACTSGMDSAVETPAFPLKQVGNGAHSGDEGSREAVVGWPPIRSFRKNTLASQKRHADQEQERPAKLTDATEQVMQPSATLFVKANMDGVPIGRKIDLKSYDSYESLKSALQEMFQRFMKDPTALEMASSSQAEQKSLNLLDETLYVLTHEDKDGDWMLVGDVPWNMFVTTVKRLRIMKVSEAVGLGPKLKTKAKTHFVEGASGK